MQEIDLPSTSKVKNIAQFLWSSQLLATVILWVLAITLLCKVGGVVTFRRARGKEKDETVWDKLTLCSHKLLGACEQEKIWLYLCCQEALSQVWLPWVSLHCACRWGQSGVELVFAGHCAIPKEGNPCLDKFGVSIGEMDAEQRKC